MPASIPNDIYQYSLISAFSNGLTSGGPPAAFLTKHGTHGIGTFADGRKMIMLDSKAWQLQADGKGQANVWMPAAGDAMLPFVMVTCFEAEQGQQTSVEMSKEEVEERILASHAGRNGSTGASGWSKHDYLSVQIRGKFESIEVNQDGQSITISNAKGTMFGFRAPSWAAATSPEGLRLHFISDADEYGLRRGGDVRGFQLMAGASVEFATCGRFHLGLPKGKQWESMDLV